MMPTPGHDAFRRCTAGFLGTFLLVFAGPGVVVIEAHTGGVTFLGIGLSFGLAVTAAIYAVGHVSGAHINPAVTLAFTLVRRFPWNHAPGYVAAQLCGALAAAAVPRALFGPVANLGATVPTGSAAQALGLELVLTFFLVFVIMAAATDVRAEGGAALGIVGYVSLPAAFAGHVAGASMNPARSFGPALVSGVWTTAHWVYWIGPAIGALLGAAYRYVHVAHPPRHRPATTRPEPHPAPPEATP